MDIKAKLIEKSDTQKVSDRFQKREFVVEFADNPQYPEFVKFELIQDKCDLLDSYEVGQELEVHFNLKGRKWIDPQGQAKYFNSLQAWRLVPASSSASTSSNQSESAVSNGNSSDDFLKDMDEDLPF
jgi:hypothetical protein